MSFVEIPVFEGFALHQWIDWMEKKFARIRIPDSWKLNLAKSLIEGEAKTYLNQTWLDLGSWDSLKAALLFWFGDEDHPARLVLLEKTCDYDKRFDLIDRRFDQITPFLTGMETNQRSSKAKGTAMVGDDPEKFVLSQKYRQRFEHYCKIKAQTDATEEFLKAKRAFLSPGSIHRVASTDAEDLIQEAVSVCANESIDPTSIHDLDSEAKISGVTDSIVAEESSMEEKLNEDLKNLVTTSSFSCTEAFMRADHIDQPQISLLNLKPDHREKILEEFGEPVVIKVQQQVVYEVMTPIVDEFQSEMAVNVAQSTCLKTRQCARQVIDVLPTKTETMHMKMEKDKLSKSWKFKFKYGDVIERKTISTEDLIQEENPQEESDSHMVNEADRKAGVMSQKVSFPALEQQSCLRSGITATCMEKAGLFLKEVKNCSPLDGTLNDEFNSRKGFVAETEVVQEPYSPCMEETEEKSISKTSEMPHNWTVVLKPANVDASFEESDDRISFILQPSSFTNLVSTAASNQMLFGFMTVTTDAENVKQSQGWTGLLQAAYCVQQGVIHPRRWKSEHQQRKFYKTWKFKYKSRILQEISLQEEASPRLLAFKEIGRIQENWHPTEHESADKLHTTPGVSMFAINAAARAFQNRDCVALWITKATRVLSAQGQRWSAAPLVTLQREKSGGSKKERLKFTQQRNYKLRVDRTPSQHRILGCGNVGTEYKFLTDRTPAISSSLWKISFYGWHFWKKKTLEKAGKKQWWLPFVIDQFKQ
ncbi:hypothetical protein F2Q68_00033368 [Brassica cretica]|uniref:Uncharacterized protein n=1 Tax=Brassica cretica TaxID=69181 RepID=A0A8S9H545_BRACR|nr:hypothetical protein F2Q68_00033368 [Brassica cretica]